MSKKVELTVEFWQKVKYQGTVTVTEQQAELIREEEGSNIKQYLDRKGSPNPIWELLTDVATESNAYDWEDELEDLEVDEYYQAD